MNESEMKAIWLILNDLKERIEKIEILLKKNDLWE